jgi:WD40 repeat protein
MVAYLCAAQHTCAEHFGRSVLLGNGHIDKLGCVSVSPAGRAYTAGGSNAFNSTLLVWDTDSYALLRVIGKRTTSWVRCVCCPMVKPVAVVFWGGRGATSGYFYRSTVPCTPVNTA